MWLNADVLPGPVNSPTIPVQVESFLSLCQLYFPTATLSIGWTTNWYPTYIEESWKYGWQHVRKMADIIRCKTHGNDYPKFTFPVRGIFVSRSIKQFQWLLSVIPNSTLTVWTGRFDPLQLDDLLQIRSSFPKNRVYYDVPENILAVFRDKKDTVVPTTYDFRTNDAEWITLTRGKGDTCSALTYVKNDTIVFGKSLTTAVLMKNLIVLKENDNLRITGKVIFFDTGDQFLAQSSVGSNELSVVLADVSLFTKDSPEHSEKEFDLNAGDTEVIWSAINSSVVYTFHHKNINEDSERTRDSEDSSCRLFKLDTSEDKSFEVWTVPCDAMLEELSFEELSSNGIPDISSRKRLVLPKGPFMLGFMSTGDKHVTIYDLKLKAHKQAFSSASSSLKTSFSLFTIITSLILVVIFI